MSIRRLVTPLCMLLLLARSSPGRADEPPKGKVAGTVVDDTGRPVSGATVILSADTPNSVAAGRSDAAGRFLFYKLPTDSYSVLVVFGASRSLTKDIRVAGDETVEVNAVLPSGPEIIDIHESAPPPSAPRPVKSTVKKLLPWSGDAMDHPEWAVGWVVLDIDPRGLVTAFRWLHRPGHDLEEIAKTELWKLRFDPARDAAGRPVSSQLLWKMEWPDYWWWNAKYLSGPSPGFAPSASSMEAPLRNAMTGRGSVAKTASWALYSGRGGRGFLLPGRDLDQDFPLPPCRGSGPMNLENLHPVYRDCSPPDLDKALTEPLIERGH